MKIDSSFKVTGFLTYDTYQGILEGNPDRINLHVMTRAKEKALFFGTPVHVKTSEPPKRRGAGDRSWKYPPLTYIISVQGPAVKLDEDDWESDPYSRLTVVTHVHDPFETLSSMLSHALEGLDWDALTNVPQGG